MVQENVLLITGLLRAFPSALNYLETSDAFSNYKVILSTWETELENNIEGLKIFEKKGGMLITTPAVQYGRHTSVVSQHVSLARGLIPEILDSTTVVKTRTDWMVAHNILADVDNISINLNDEKIFTSGFIPSSPFFLPDGHFVSSAKKLRKISNLDIVDMLRYSYIHPEQNFFLPNFGQRSGALETYLATDVGTQFDSLATSQWTRLRLKSRLFYYVIGEYFNWVHRNTAPIRYEEFKLKNLEIKEFLFGFSSQHSSLKTRLILRNHLDLNFLGEVSFPNKSFESYFWRGFNGSVLESDELKILGNELENGINRNLFLRNARRTIDAQNFSIPREIVK